jgi:transcriptional regulator with XRE-family HTH domain
MKKVDALSYFKQFENFSTQEKLADELGITQSAISHWPELVPRECAIALAELSENELDGKLKFDPELYKDRYHGPKKRKSVAA